MKDANVGRFSLVVDAKEDSEWKAQEESGSEWRLSDVEIFANVHDLTI